VSLPGLEESVSDWITARLGHIPRPNEAVAAGTLTFTVRRIRRQRAFEVMVTSSSKPLDSQEAPVSKPFNNY
jgi:CBS domain containing-hemolysin-like protein